MIPVPFPCNPGDKLRVTAHHPWGTELVTGDLVTVESTGIKVEEGRPVPIVVVFTAHGRQILGLDAVEPYILPEYAPAEPDDVTDAFLLKMAEADPELADVFAMVNVDLAAMDAAAPTLAGGPTVTSSEEGTNRRMVGESYAWADPDGDELEVTYFEQDCEHHGREGIFYLTINEEESVVIPAAAIDGLLRYLVTRKKHSERPQN